MTTANDLDDGDLLTPQQQTTKTGQTATFSAFFLPFLARKIRSSFLQYLLCIDII
jgi:hypothetical protein